MTLKAQAIRAKIDKWDYIKLKNFRTSKETILITKKQHTKWEKIFANYVSDKELIPSIYKELLQLDNKIHILFKRLQNIYQDRPYLRP